ncbi:MAG: hypothetical protein H7228_15430 [Polaromonas sp.]|nr:hypothetical protein [Polaromonas sp.]
MTALKIALLGVPDTGTSRLATHLNYTLQASNWSAAVLIVMAPTGQQFDLIFLMGLESATADMQRADNAIRAALMHDQTTHEVLYGSASERHAQVIKAIAKRLGKNSTSDPKGDSWVWTCDNCSDPHCEHKLFTDLLEKRTAEATVIAK